MKNIPVTAAEALKKAMKYCAADEHCIAQVRTKLIDWKLPAKEIPAIVETLIRDNFIDEQRFAAIYARSKFNQKGWGRIKISAYLKQLGVAAELISSGLETIDEESYTAKLESVLRKKLHTLPVGMTLLEQKQKLLASGITRGFEKNLVMDYLHRILP